MGRRILSKEEWLKRKKTVNMILLSAAVILFIIIVLYSVIFITKMLKVNKEEEVNTDSISESGIGSSADGLKETILETLSNGQIVKLDYLTPNPYSRPQTKLEGVKGIVIHYTANPGTTADNNRNYFEGLADKQTTSASSHFIIGLEGEVVQCIPLTEIAYASNDRNIDTISVECCHPDESGEFNEETYDSLVSLVAQLCVEFNIENNEVIRHYDVTEKPCPLYYVEHEDAWVQLKADIDKEVQQLESEMKW
jgi:hypothetical protein